MPLDNLNLIDILGIAGALLSGMNFLLISLFKIYHKLTFERLEENQKLNRKDFELEREKNTAFRHEYKGLTKNLFSHVENEIKLVSVKLENITKLEKKVDKLIEDLNYYSNKSKNNVQF